MSAVIKIESGIPGPMKSTSPILKEAIKQMNVGDSFDSAGVDLGNPITIKTRAYNFARRLGFKLSWRGTRVWRVA